MRKLDSLTELVIKYKEGPTDKLISNIYYSKSIKKMVWGVFKYYGIINSFPLTILENLEEDCRSLVLLKCIKRYDLAKKASFGTFFTWWCMSHVRNIKMQHLKREPLLNAISLNRNVYNGHEGTKIEDIVTNFNENALHHIKRHIREGNLEGIDVYNDHEDVQIKSKVPFKKVPVYIAATSIVEEEYNVHIFIDKVKRAPRKRNISYV